MALTGGQGGHKYSKCMKMSTPTLLWCWCSNPLKWNAGKVYSFDFSAVTMDIICPLGKVLTQYDIRSQKWPVTLGLTVYVVTYRSNLTVFREDLICTVFLYFLIQIMYHKSVGVIQLIQCCNLGTSTMCDNQSIPTFTSRTLEGWGRAISNQIDFHGEGKGLDILYNN